MNSKLTLINKLESDYTEFRENLSYHQIGRTIMIIKKKKEKRKKKKRQKDCRYKIIFFFLILMYKI